MHFPGHNAREPDHIITGMSMPSVVFSLLIISSNSSITGSGFSDSASSEHILQPGRALVGLLPDDSSGRMVMAQLSLRSKI